MAHKIKNKWQSRIANEIKHNRWNASNAQFRIESIKNQLFSLIEQGLDKTNKTRTAAEELKKARYDFNATTSRIRELKKVAKAANKAYRIS